MLSILLVGGIEDNTKTLDPTGGDVYEGQPLSLDPITGYLKPSNDSLPVYGLSKLNANKYINLVSSGVEGYASGKITVAKKNVVRIVAETFNQVEVMGTNASVTVALYTTEVFQPGNELYASGTGLITKTPGTHLLGTCNNLPAVDGYMDIDLAI
jgi:hypothetical protein